MPIKRNKKSAIDGVAISKVKGENLYGVAFYYKGTLKDLAEGFNKIFEYHDPDKKKGVKK